VPRALVFHRTIVPAPNRARYMEALQRRKAHFERNGCRFWVFEEAGLPGAFIEFMEANERTALKAAIEQAPESPLDANRVYVEVPIP
jgi:hypothetical protein